MTEQQMSRGTAGRRRPISKTPGVPVAYDLLPERTALVSIDFQIAFGDGGWEHVPHAEAAVERFIALAERWREAGGAVLHVHSTFPLAEGAPAGREALLEGSPGAAFYPGLMVEGDLLIRKLGFSAVSGSGLLEVLDSCGLDTVVLGGLTTPICVETTADGLSMAGIKVAVLSDATASQAIGEYSPEIAHDFSIARMSYLVGQVTTTRDLIAGLAGSSDDDAAATE